ncbi:MAG: hypothetical protein U1E15_10065 [Hyphomicrobiales bacterium]
MTKTTPQTAPKPQAEKRRVSPECLEVLKMLSSLDGRPVQSSQ